MLFWQLNKELPSKIPKDKNNEFKGLDGKVSKSKEPVPIARDFKKDSLDSIEAKKKPKEHKDQFSVELDEEAQPPKIPKVQDDDY